MSHMRLRPAFSYLLAATLSFMLVVSIVIPQQPAMSAQSQLLTDPFLQLPTENSVRVVWFTEFAGQQHTVDYGAGLRQSVAAVTTKLSRTREDAKSNIPNPPSQPTMRDIWRHEAIVTGLRDRVPYRVTSVNDAGESLQSQTFTLAPKPDAGESLKILLTSDHQLMPMTATNLQKVEETIGRVDAVFLAGDLINIPDRASEWFDDIRGGAFFPALQGRAAYELEKDGVTTTYRGGEIIQHAPLYPAVGNHEVMGAFSNTAGLNQQFNSPIPRGAAAEFYNNQAKQINPQADPKVRQAWIQSASYNTDTFDEIFTLPPDRPAGKNYYAVTFGDIRLISLYITNIWRVPSLEADRSGRYVEAKPALDDPTQWGYGQHIFEPIKKGSDQYNWLVQELQRPEFQQARYKIVMFHHPPHTLGDNIVPAYTDPVQLIERDEAGKITAVRYEYPKDDDYIMRDVVPLLEEAGVQLVYYGHSHLWNRFISPQGTHYLESSNVGNTYGASTADNPRSVPENFQEEYVAIGDPNGLEPVMPTISPLQPEGEAIPFIASNDITVFSILDTAAGTVSSYRFDTRQPNSPVEKFDQFQLVPAIAPQPVNRVSLIVLALLTTTTLAAITWMLRDLPPATVSTVMSRFQ